MMQEEKQLLLKDLCARLPYGVKVDVSRVEEWKELTLTPFILSNYYDNIEKIKPYLRPMSSMTEEERQDFAYYVAHGNNSVALDFVDWCNAHHFDHRGLIGKGLALEAPEDMYKTEKNMEKFNDLSFYGRENEELQKEWERMFPNMPQEEKELTLDSHAGEFEAFLYSPSDEFLGIIRNEVTLLAFQCKVCEASKEGYYLIYDGKKYNIEKTGKIMDNFPIHYIDDYISFIVGF